MIFTSILVWLSVIVVGMSSEIPDCTDKINQVLAVDNLQGAKVTIENYPFGISLIFQKGDYKYDYYYTDDENMNSEAESNGYDSFGKCLINKTPVYFTRVSQYITQGA